MQKMKSAKNLKKTPPIIAAPAPRDPEAESQFEMELCWCIQQLEKVIYEGKHSKKLRDEALKNHKTLKSSTAPVVKKRQVMKTAFGDYRKKMKDEEKKLALAAKQIKFTPRDEATQKSSFVKKAAILTSGKDFKFNFNPDSSVETPPECSESKEKDGVKGSKLYAMSKDISFSAGFEFKFNFSIEGADDDISIDKLSINS